MIALVENGVGPSVEPAPLSKLKRTVSASRLNCWLQCRLKFYFRYVLKISKTEDRGIAFRQRGASGVAAMEHGAGGASSPSRSRSSSRCLRPAGSIRAAGSTGTARRPEQKTSAWAVLEKYFTETPIKADEMPEAVEVPVEADLSKHGLPILIGVLDLVRAGGRIVDFKSAGKTPDNEMALHQNGVQLDCYSVLYREATGKREAGRELHQNGTPT